MRISASLAGFFGIALLTSVFQAAGQIFPPPPPGITPTPGGHYTPPLTVKIIKPDPGATPYYTNETPPTIASWMKYSGPFILPYSATISAVGVDAGQASNVASEKYSVNWALQFIPVECASS